MLRVVLARPGVRKAEHYRHASAAAWVGIISADACEALTNVVADELEYWGQLSPSKHFIDESNFCGLMVENTHSVTTAADLPAMMASVEMRAPFLDQEIFSFAAAVHYRCKVPHGRDSGRLKLILRKAVEDLVPADLLRAEKRGFGTGIQESMVFRGPWRKYLNDLLLDPESLEGLFDPNAIRSAWSGFLAGRSDDAGLIGRLAAMQAWARLRAARAGGTRNRAA